MSDVLLGGSLVILLVGALIDLQTRRIPNWLTFGGALAGLLANVAVYQVDGVRWSLGGWLAGVLLLAIPFALRGTGAGDVKLLAAAGAWAGPSFVVYALCFGAVAGGVVALGLLLARRQFVVVYRPGGAFVRHWAALALGSVGLWAFGLTGGSNAAQRSQSVERRVYRFPYGPALAIGGLIEVVVR